VPLTHVRILLSVSMTLYETPQVLSGILVSSSNNTDLFRDAMLTSWGNSLQYWQSYSAKFSIVVYKLTTILNYLIYAIADKFITWAYGPAQAHPPRDWMPKRSFNNDDTKLWCRNKPLSRCRIKNEKTGRRDVFKFPRTIKFLLLENTSLASLKWNTMLLISTI
jgi:hypothetical protein